MKTSFLFILLIFFSFGLSAQSDKVEFKAEWKADTLNNIVKVTIISGDPLCVILFDKMPSQNGKPICKTDIKQRKIVELEKINKEKLCVCVFKDSISFSCKWLDVE
jgi:hypothetical protein